MLLCVDRLPYPEFVCIKVDFVVLSPSMFCYVTTGFTLFDVSFMFLFSRSESTAGFTYITPNNNQRNQSCIQRWSVPREVVCPLVTGNVVLTTYGVVSLWF